MDRIAWHLSDDGKELTLFKYDMQTRLLRLSLPLKRSTPMTPEEALKFVNDNYPTDGNSVRAAADSLGLLAGSR